MRRESLFFQFRAAVHVRDAQRLRVRMKFVTARPHWLVAVEHALLIRCVHARGPVVDRFR